MNGETYKLQNGKELDAMLACSFLREIITEILALYEE